MRGVEQELVGHVLPRQWLLRAAAQIRLPILDHAAVPERGADVAGVIVRIGIVRIDHELNLGSECQHTLIADRAFRERAEPDAAMHKAGGQQIRYGELGGIAVARTLLVGERLPSRVRGPPLPAGRPHSRCTVPSATSQTISATASGLMPRAASRRAQSIYGCA